ncbi:hypothetical protein [Paenibacillus sp. IITD108]|uniref:hypothetical protein n=1 Tax=Paenibacillus sp. IITD108 TaxID=3116649 RepID=UPI002F40BA84
MKSFKDELKELLGTNPVVEVESRSCEGCGEKVIVMEANIFAGPRKGEKIQREVGCKCFELAEARQALVNHKKFLTGDRYE